MIKVRKFRKGEEETLRQLCIDTNRHVTALEYGAILVEKWCARLASSARWRDRVQRKNPWVAVSDSVIVGFAELTEPGQIGAFYSHFQWQGKGVGSALLEALESEAQKIGFETICVDSSMSASRFFERKGFRAVEERQALTDGIPSRSLFLVKSARV